MKMLLLCISMSILLSCSSQSDKKALEEKNTEEEEYSAPSSNPGPIPGVDQAATAVALR